MSDATRAEVEALSKFANAAEQSANNIRGQLSTLLTNLQPLHSSWVGHGGSSFQATASTVHTEVTNIHRLLTAMAEDVRTAGVHYAAADEDQGREMRNIQAATSGITQGLT